MEGYENYSILLCVTVLHNDITHNWTVLTTECVVLGVFVFFQAQVFV